MMTKKPLIKGTIKIKTRKEIVVTGTHVFNAVGCVAVIMLTISLLQWWQTGEQPKLEIVLCLLPAIMCGSYNVVKWLQRRR